MNFFKKSLSSKFFIFIFGIILGSFLSVTFLNHYINIEILRPEPAQGKLKSYSLTHDNLDRTYDVFVPDSLKKNAPVFFIFHGSYGTSAGMRGATGFDFEYLAQEKGFLVVYPQGYKNFWNDCRGSADYEANLKDVDDIGYYKKVINLIEKDFGINKNNIISTGISNGGHMVYKLAYEIPKSTFLHAPLVANLPIKNNNDCDISEVEVNMAIFNGTNDQINPYNGGLVSLLGNDSRGEVLSSEESYKYWRDLSFFEEENFKILPERDENLNSSVTKKDVIGSKIVALYTLVNGGHIYASPNVKYSSFFGGNVNDINTAEEIYKIFENLKINN